jgi:hypothetical protein
MGVPPKTISVVLVQVQSLPLRSHSQGTSLLRIFIVVRVGRRVGASSDGVQGRQISYGLHSDFGRPWTLPLYGYGSQTMIGMVRSVQFW